MLFILYPWTLWGLARASKTFILYPLDSGNPFLPLRNAFGSARPTQHQVGKMSTQRYISGRDDLIWIRIDPANHMKAVLSKSFLFLYKIEIWLYIAIIL